MIKEAEKVGLHDRQHAELLHFASHNLQDIRDIKADQRQAVFGALALVGALLGLWENLESRPDWAWCLFTLLIGGVVVGSGAMVVSFQITLLRFRRRQQRILDNHFVLNLEPILGTQRSYSTPEEKQSLSLVSGLLVLYLMLLMAAGMVAVAWILAT